jgi:hypothetical protein
MLQNLKNSQIHSDTIVEGRGTDRGDGFDWSTLSVYMETPQ